MYLSNPGKAWSCLVCLLVTACGGGSDPQQQPPPQPQPTTYTIGGTVSGLTGSGLALTLNGSGNLGISGNGSFTFPTAMAGGASYNVAVATQPGAPTQFCAIAAGVGTVVASNVTSVLVTCSIGGRFAYVANNGLNSIDSVSAYAINRTTGLLTPVPGSPFGAGHTPISVAVHANGKFLYALNPVGMPQNGALTVFSINGATGMLAPIGGSPFALSSASYAMALDPVGKFAFVAKSTSSAPGLSVHVLDANTGVPALVAGSPFAIPGGGIPVAVTANADGKFVYVGTQGGGPGNLATIVAYSVNATTGALTLVAGSPFAPPGVAVVRSLSADPAGKFLFGVGSGVVAVYAIDSATGALTAVAGSPFAAGSNPQTVTTDPAGKFLYVSHDSNGANSLIYVYSINATSGALAQIAGSPFASSNTPFFITIDPSGDLAYVANLGSDAITVYSVNKNTGTLGSTGSPLSNGVGTNPGAIAILK
jgi:6-phosphogluconolactonase